MTSPTTSAAEAAPQNASSPSLPLALAHAMMSRMGALTTVPKALARTNGALHLWRETLNRAPAPVAPHAADVVMRIGAARLLRYQPTQPVRTDLLPVLLCPSLINRLYILDLQRGISLVEELLNAGHVVYGIEWGEPGPEEHGVGIAGFVARLSMFLTRACSDAHVQKMHVLGHCLGGTLATLLAATDDRHMASLVNLTTPLGFHDQGMLSRFTRTTFFDPQLLVDVVGHVPGWVTQPAFQLLKPMGNTTKVLRLYQSLDKPQFLTFFRCLETWINDNVSIPDTFFVELNRDLYRKDALQKGEFVLGDAPVSLRRVRVPVLSLAAEQDHIVPVASATKAAAQFGSDVNRVEVLPGGHIGIVVGSLARRKLWPMLLTFFAEHSAHGDVAVPAPSHNAGASKPNKKQAAKGGEA